MMTWLYRWDNGDCSIVWARNRMDAALLLDEVGEANPKCLVPLPAGAAHFMLSDGAILERESFSERLETFIEKIAYPLIHKATMQGLDQTDVEMAAIAEAERQRLVQPRDLAKTPQGRLLQKHMGLTGALADEMALAETPETDGTT